jgi:hypothetical protein
MNNDNNDNTDNNIITGPTLEQPAQPEPAPGFVCDKCGKFFDRKNQLDMHTMRVHTRAGQQGALWKKSLTPEKQKALEQKRKWNRRMRERYIARGLTSTGKPRKRPTNRGEGRPKTGRDYYKMARDRFYKQGLNAKGQPFSKGHKMSAKGRENIRAAQNERRQREAVKAEGKAKKRIRFVYPLPEMEPERYRFAQPAEPTAPAGPTTLHNLRFCPHCGEHLEKWNKS